MISLFQTTPPTATTLSGKCGPFRDYAHHILETCRQKVHEENLQRVFTYHANLYFLPDLGPLIVKLCEYLPLWSGIMCAAVGYGDTPPSSTAVESQFSVLKEKILGGQDKRARIDDFLERHIVCLLGHSKETTARQNQTTDQMSTARQSRDTMQPDVYEPFHNVSERNVNSEISNVRPLQNKEASPSVSFVFGTITTLSEQECVACSAGNLPTGAHRCIHCKKPVHILDGCSISIGEEEGFGEKRACRNCQSMQVKRIRAMSTTAAHTVPDIQNEETAEENWRNISENPANKMQKRKNTKKGYLHKYTEIKHRNKFSRARTKVIGLLKNGNDSTLSSVNINKTNYVLTNTCAFDSLVQLLAVAFCDSELYAAFVFQEEETGEGLLYNLVHSLIKCGVTVQSYRKRARILLQLRTITTTDLPNEVRSINVEGTVDILLGEVMRHYPSMKVISRCPNCNRKSAWVKYAVDLCVPKQRPSVTELQQLISSRLNTLRSETVKCNCQNTEKETIVEIQKHIFFNVLNIAQQGKSHYGTEDIQLHTNNIPKSINVPDGNASEEYILRGAITTPDYQQGASFDRLGHYHTHGYREPYDKWQLFDDMEPNVTDVRPTLLNVQILLYTL